MTRIHIVIKEKCTFCIDAKDFVVRLFMKCWQYQVIQKTNQYLRLNYKKRLYSFKQNIFHKFKNRGTQNKIKIFNLQHIDVITNSINKLVSWIHMCLNDISNRKE